MRSDLRYVIVGKGFNKYAVTGRSKLTDNKALAITRENDKIETCICFEDSDDDDEGDEDDESTEVPY